MSEHWNGVVAASAQWLLTAYPPPADPFAAASAQWQAGEAASVAARLRYPTDADDALLELCGPAAPSGWIGWPDPIPASAASTARPGAPGWTRSWSAGRQRCSVTGCSRQRRRRWRGSRWTGRW